MCKLIERFNLFQRIAPAATLAAGAMVLACGPAAAQVSATASWPAGAPADRVYFCGTDPAGADDAGPSGFGGRLSAALRQHGAVADPKRAMRELSSVAACGRSHWTMKTAGQPVKQPAGMPGPQGQIDAWGLMWPANSPQDAAWLCGNSRQAPKSYTEHAMRAQIARVLVGIHLVDAPADIHNVAGCPLQGDPQAIAQHP